MSGTIFLVCLTSATISAYFVALRISAWPAARNRWRKGCKNRKEKKGSWQSQSRWWTWSHVSRQVLRLCKIRLRRKARGYSMHPVEQPRPSRTLKFNVYTLFLMILLSVRLKFEAYNCKMSGMTSKGVLQTLKIWFNLKNKTQHCIFMNMTSIVDIIFNVHTLKPSFLWSLAQLLRKQGWTPWY